MRRAQYHRRQSQYLPNASTLGYGKYRAQVGDWVTFKAGDQLQIGRMVGRVKDTDPIATEERRPIGFLAVLTLSMELTHAYVRWVDPADVTEVHANVPDIGRFLAWFCGALPDAETCAYLGEYGALSACQGEEIIGNGYDASFAAGLARGLASYQARNRKDGRR